MESTLQSCLCSTALIAVDLLLDFMEDAKPELSNVSANEYPVSTKVQTRHMLCCLCCHTVNKPPISDGPFPPHSVSNSPSACGRSGLVILLRHEKKDATSFRPYSKSVTELRNYFLTFQVFIPRLPFL